jgi:hypothetical protein
VAARKIEGTAMRSVIAAVLTAAVLLVGFFGAPVVPVAVGAGIAGGWAWWRRAGTPR